MQQAIVLLFIIVAQLHLLAPVDALDKLRVNRDGFFVDSHNHVVLLHGVNWVVKMPPYYDVQMLNASRLTLFQQLGINVVRLGVSWPALFPQRNQPNTTYLELMTSVVDLMASHSIYVIIDLHQDVLAARFGTYDGLPSWLLDDIAPSSNGWLAYPWPFSSQPSDWFLNYITYASAATAQSLYNNESNAWTYWGDYWHLVGSTLVQRNNVLGYELMNEPPPGNFYTKPFRLFPGRAGYTNLLPVYDYLVGRIRQVDQETLIFYEPITYGIFFYPWLLSLGTGFERVPGGLSSRDTSEQQRSVLSYHYYCWIVQTADTRQNMTALQKYLCNQLLLPSVMSNAEHAIEVTRGGKFLTEFGLCAPDGNPESINTIECNRILDETDRHFESWTYWDGHFLDQQGNVILEQANSFSRAYPQSTAGRPRSLRFNPETSRLHYTFTVNKTLVSNTTRRQLASIFIPTLVHYVPTTTPDDTPDIDSLLNVTVSPAGLTWQLIDCDDSPTLHLFDLDDKHVETGQLIEVTIAPA